MGWGGARRANDQVTREIIVRLQEVGRLFPEYLVRYCMCTMPQNTSYVSIETYYLVLVRYSTSTLARGNIAGTPKQDNRKLNTRARIPDRQPSLI